jgi:hypothetical protein
MPLDRIDLIKGASSIPKAPPMQCASASRQRDGDTAADTRWSVRVTRSIRSHVRVPMRASSGYITGQNQLLESASYWGTFGRYASWR